MTIFDCATEEELEDMAEQIEEINFKHLELMDEVKERREELEMAEKELLEFQEDNKEFLLAT